MPKVHSQSVHLDERTTSSRCGLLLVEKQQPLLSNSGTLARNTNTVPDFSGWNKNSSKWVKYEKVTVLSSPLLTLNGSPWPKWGWMWADEDSPVGARAINRPRERQGQRREEELSLKTGLVVASFRYPSVEDLQNTVRSCVQCVGWQWRLGGGQGACACTDLPASLGAGDQSSLTLALSGVCCFSLCVFFSDTD